ncbi:MAG: CoA transferase [Gemmatimonadales bacterium]|nr:CoA transferase [Gemmatimonadales bacterium]MBA3553168.1 CoA transferase [Gemmatimonadales bacterium]
MTPPLAGIRVLDLTRVLAGPLCTMTLGDLGADVLKVERPGTGDETRHWGPPFDEQGESAYYLAVNRNKLSVALDLDDADDSTLLRGLLAGAHVAVDNFRPGTLERRGLDPAALLAANPALIWCTLTGFGLASARPGYDFVVQAESGWMAITGEATGTPMKMGVALADVLAGKDAAVAVLAALAGRERLRTAEERRLVVSLAHSATAALVNVAQNALVSGEEPARWGNAHPNLVPYQLFPTADRPIVIAVGSDPQWIGCCRALGREDLAGDPNLAGNAGRVGRRAEVASAIADTLATRPAVEWLDRLGRHGVPAGVLRRVTEALADVVADARTGIAPLAPATIRLPPPRLDQHGDEVRRLGWRAFEG